LTNLANPDSSAVVLIGTAEYDHAEVENVRSVDTNLDHLHNALVDPNIWGIDSNKIIQLRNADSAGAVARALRVAAENTGEDGLFLVYFAGHGFPGETDLMLGLRNVDPAYPEEQGLSYDHVQRAVRAARTLRRMVILDCCFAGRAGREVLDAGDAVKQIVNQAEIQTETTGLLVAVGPNALAMAPRDKPNTAFTGALLKVVRTGLDVLEPTLTVRTVADEVIRQVVLDGYPRPQFRETNGAGGLPFVRNIGLQQGNLTGRVLDSSTKVTDPELRQTSIFILRHDQTGALGVRLNRAPGPLPFSLDRWPADKPPLLLDGGPVARDGFIALVQLREEDEKPIRFEQVTGLIGSLPLSDSQPIIPDRVASLRVFRGYLGWGPGALERMVAARLLTVRGGPPGRAVFANHHGDWTSR
jgi:putative AlgH/UPF0301 family transcriptional regulator